MEVKYCQSCAMPMDDSFNLYGTDADGGTNTDYCKYCFTNGVFVSDCSMDEMIETCIPHMVAAHAEMTAEAARTMMKEYLPTLKRWK